MDKMIVAEINGKKRYLHYSIECLFAVNEKYGSVQTALEILQKDNRESFEAVRYLAALMANDAELCRRAEGFTAEEMISENDIPLRMSPGKYALLMDAVCEAIAEGYRQEQEDEDEETDLGLAELRKK